MKSHQMGLQRHWGEWLGAKRSTKKYSKRFQNISLGSTAAMSHPRAELLTMMTLNSVFEAPKQLNIPRQEPQLRFQPQASVLRLVNGGPQSLCFGRLVYQRFLNPNRGFGCRASHNGSEAGFSRSLSLSLTPLLT